MMKSTSNFVNQKYLYVTRKTVGKYPSGMYKATPAHAKWNHGI